jgi:hypothetical protein
VIRLFSLILLSIAAGRAFGGEADALSISSTIQQRHMPYNTILSPVFASPASSTLVSYSRCGDSAIWTGHYLAAEAFRYSVTRSPQALANAARALTGLESLVNVTGTGVLARCLVPAGSPYAAAITQEEAHNGVRSGTINGEAYLWIGNTSRDQYAGVFFGLGIAYDMIAETALRTRVSALATRMLEFLLSKNWAVTMPDGGISTVFWGRPDQQLSFLQVGRHLNAARFDSTYRSYRLAYASSVAVPISYEVLDDHNSYFKFNLATISLYNLIRLEDNSTYRWFYNNAYDVLRRTTDDHRNAHFHMIDRGLKGAAAARDAETRALLNEWLLRPRRDNYVDLRPQYPSCGAPDRACSPIPVAERVRTDFLWQRSPFLLYGGGSGVIETPGVDYILPYWMGRHYGVVAANAAPAVVSVTPNAGSGSSQVFRFVASDADGSADLQVGLVVLNAVLSAANSCYVYYDKPAGIVYLSNDAGTGWSAPAALGSAAILRNGQCSLNLSGSSVTLTPTELSLNLALTFTAGFRGNKSSFFYAIDKSGAGSGWRQTGAWTVP